MSRSFEAPKKNKSSRARPNLTENMESTLAGEVKTADLGFDFIKDTAKMSFTENKKMPTIDENDGDSTRVDDKRSSNNFDNTKRLTVSSSDSDNNELSDISDDDSDSDI